jgi:hypothetical protein
MGIDVCGNSNAYARPIFPDRIAFYVVFLHLKHAENQLNEADGDTT